MAAEGQEEDCTADHSDVGDDGSIHNQLTATDKENQNPGANKNDPSSSDCPPGSEADVPVKQQDADTAASPDAPPDDTSTDTSTSKARLAAAVVSEVLLPLLQQSGKPPGSLARDADADTNIAFSSSPASYQDLWEKLQLTMDRAAAEKASKENGAFKLELPEDLPLDDLDALIDDYDAVSHLEESAEKWRTVADTAIKAEKDRETAKGPWPLDEVEFWRRRSVALSGLVEQATSANVRNVIQALRHHSSPVAGVVDRRLSEIVHLSACAADNAKYLSTLIRYLAVLQSNSLKDVISALPSLMEAIRLIIWTSSRHYNRAERLVPLMERIAWQLLQRVKEQIDISVVLRGDLKTVKSMVSDAKRLLESWHELYVIERDRIDKDGRAGLRQWADLDSKRLFDKTKYAVSVCDNLYASIVCVEQYHNFIESNLVAQIIGCGRDNQALTNIIHQIKDLPNHIESVADVRRDVDIFDSGSEGVWIEAIRKFNQKAEEIDALCIETITFAFQDLRCSSVDVFDIAESFGNDVTCRPEIHRHVGERYVDILNQYERELVELEQVFESKKDNPPIGIDHCFTSGSISWALSLYDRAKSPILRFKSRDGLLSSAKGDEIKERYLSFAKRVDAYKEDILKDWRERAPLTTSEGMRLPVLARIESDDAAEAAVVDSSFAVPSKAEGASVRFCSAKSTISGCHTKTSSLKKCSRSLKSYGGASVANSNYTSGQDNRGATEGMFLHNMFGRTVPLASNFPNQVFELIKEAKQLGQMGISVPLNLHSVALQERRYHEYVMELDEMVKLYNASLSSLTTLETHLLKQHIRRMDEAILPGLTTLNWTSLRISAFVEAGKLAIERFRCLLKEVRKSTACIDISIGRIESAALIADNAFADIPLPVSLSTFIDVAQKAIQARVDSLVREYQSIKPLMIEIELAVAESNCASAPALAEFYSHCERRLNNALVKMTVRSLVSFLHILAARSSEGARHDAPLCCITPSLLADNTVALEPSIEDMSKQLDKCIMHIMKAPKQFVRWMAGSCIEISPQTLNQDDSTCGKHHIYTFHKDVSSNVAVVGALDGVKQQKDLVLRSIEKHVCQWRRSVREQLAFDKSAMEEYLLHSSACEYFESLLGRYQDIAQLYRNTTDGNGGKRTVLVGSIQVDCTNVARQASERAHDIKIVASELLRLDAKKRLDAFDNQIKALSSGLLMPDSGEDHSEISSVLDTIQQILTCSEDMHHVCNGIIERYKTLRNTNALVPADEITAALSVDTEWQGLVVNAKSRYQHLVEDNKEAEDQSNSKIS